MVDFPIVNFATHQDVVLEVAGLGIIKRDRLQLLPPLGERDSRDNPRLSSIHHFNSSEEDEDGRVRKSDTGCGRHGLWHRPIPI